MKTLLIIIFSCSISLQLFGTDPIKPKRFYVGLEASLPVYHYLSQAEFKRANYPFGFAINAGHRSFPLYAEYTFHTPVKYAYLNNKLSSSIQQVGIRYNLNRMSYIIPHGIDPYVGIGLVNRNNIYQKYEITDGANGTLKEEVISKEVNYALSAGLKVGNRNFVFGLHYQYLPSKLVVAGAENNLTFYQNSHTVFARIGMRLHPMNSKGIKCPRFRTKHKRTLNF